MTPRSTQDVVLSMTLAEVFLLLMFVVWWWSTIEALPEGKDGSVDAVSLQVKVEELSAQVERLRRDNDDLRARLEILREMLDAGDSTEEELRKAFKRKMEEAKRGSPACAPSSNVLAHVERLDGTETLTVLQDTAVYFGHVGFPKGDKLKTPAQIDGFLAAVSTYYRSRSNCRFDYRLTWTTDADYRLARTRYESRHFYNAGVTRKSDGR